MAKSTSTGTAGAASVSRHIRALGSKAANERATDYYLSRYGSRDTQKPRDGLPRIWIDAVDRAGQERMLIAYGEIIVRTADAGRAAGILGRAYRRAAVRGVAPLRLTRFSAEVPAARILADVQRLRSHCIDASPNGINAYAMRSKASTTPDRPPTGKLTKVGPTDGGAGIHVVVIDTGLADDADTRSDQFFAGIAIDHAGKSNVDRLTAVNEAHNLGAILDAAAGHGTFVTSMIRRQARKATVTMIRALNSDGIATDADVAKAILDAARLKPHIVNMSFGSEDVDGGSRPIPITDAIAEAQLISPSTLFIAAAGNDANKVETYPAALPGVVAVAGLTAAFQGASWSKRGPWVQVSVPVEGVIGAFVHGTERSVPGMTQDTWGPLLRNPDAVWLGTSFAAPSVAGAVAAEMTTNKVAKARTALDNLMANGTTIPDWGVGLKIK